jgi:penicillin-binding protein 1B
VAVKVKIGRAQNARPQSARENSRGQNGRGNGRNGGGGRRTSLLRRPRLLPWLIAIPAGLFVLLCLAVGITFSFYYYKYKHVVDERLQKPLFVETAKIFAAPQEVRVGQKLTPQSIAQLLRSAGYTQTGERAPSRLGTFSVGDEVIKVHPGPESYHSQEGATIDFAKGKVASIAGDQGQALAAYELEPQLITGLSEGANRTKRRLVTYNELPPRLVQAVTSIEDRRFFEHGGVDYYRLVGALRDDLLAGRKREGGSTLTMQLARGFFLTPEKRFKRKLIEIAITFQLENRFNKQQIFAMYANQVPLGQQGSFAINGFGEAAEAYFGKDVRQLNLAECALLAGMIQHPSFLNPYRHPKRAITRRNVVLDAMVDTGDITTRQASAAKAEPLHLVPPNADAGEAPYFVDLVRDQLGHVLGSDTDYNSEGLRIYTSLDPDLQHAALEAVGEGMKRVDEQLDKRRARLEKLHKPANIPTPQVALIALNPHTGQVLALVGGRNYGQSQYDHAVAHRPTGSIFKPIVYAAAYNTSLSGTQLTTPAIIQQVNPDAANAKDATTGQMQSVSTPGAGTEHSIFSATTMLDNDLLTFEDGYSPGNFHGEKYTGEVTARVALAMSLNNATVELAQMVGYDNVAALAREMGVKSARGTPAVALGAYDATPLEMAGAYTTFANGGVHIDPWMLASVRSANGDVMNDFSPSQKPILDPRVAYLTTSLMETVINAGTGLNVRRDGFAPPAAGKTGTSHDVWFAGYTSNLLCVIWVGNDDYSDIKMQGATTAAPMWAAFMKRAVALPQYSDTKEFEVPSGVSLVRLDRQTNLLADDSCPKDYYAAFLDGTAPTRTCSQPPVDTRGLFQRIFGVGKPAPTVTPGQPNLPVAQQPAQPAPGYPPQPGQQTAEQPPAVQEKPKKRGFFGRLFGGGRDKQQQQQQPAPQPE